jgi:hypothetical protein
MSIRRQANIPLACAVVLIGVVVPVSARATTTTSAGQVDYYAHGWDADDDTRWAPDVRRSLREVVTTPAHRWLVVRVTSFEPWGDWWRMHVDLDSRNGPKADFRLEMHNGDMDWPAGCSVKRIGSGTHGRTTRGRFHQEGNSVGCKIPVVRVHPDKHIRWRIATWSLNSGQGSDRAPDRGWYP